MLDIVRRFFYPSEGQQQEIKYFTLSRIEIILRQNVLLTEFFLIPLQRLFGLFKFTQLN
jgi:hypothetical protein